MVAVIADGWFGENINRCRIKLKKKEKLKIRNAIKVNICYKTITKDGYVNFWFMLHLEKTIVLNGTIVLKTIKYNY